MSFVRRVSLPIFDVIVNVIGKRQMERIGYLLHGVRDI
jgi:hypothetical protein